MILNKYSVNKKMFWAFYDVNHFDDSIAPLYLILSKLRGLFKSFDLKII